MSRKHGTSDPSTGKETLDADFAANGSIDYDDPIQYQRQDLYREETTREIADHVAEIIGLLGEDFEREGLVKTPERVAKGLTVSATTDDGLIEGLESDAHTWVVGVQWHPERIDPHVPGFDTGARKLYEAFATAVRAHAAR